MPPRRALILLSGLALAGCDPWMILGSEDCEATPALGVGTWTEEFYFVSGDDPDDSCTCEPATPDCQALYQGRVDGVQGNTAWLRFKKVNGDLALTDYTWWLVEISGERLPSCADRETWTTRDSGTWREGEAELAIQTSVWPSEASFYAAEPGEMLRLGLVTGGLYTEDERIWFLPEPLDFIRSCR